MLDWLATGDFQFFFFFKQFYKATDTPDGFNKLYMRKEEEDYTMAKKEKNNCTRVFSYENGRCHQDCYIYFIRSGFWVFFLLTIAANGKKDGDDVKGGGKVDSFSPHVNVTNCLETKRYPVSWWGERESSWPR
jgi:hypothetical protein